jgi:hypothetical protein
MKVFTKLSGQIAWNKIEWVGVRKNLLFGLLIASALMGVITIMEAQGQSQYPSPYPYPQPPTGADIQNCKIAKDMIAAAKSVNVDPNTIAAEQKLYDDTCGVISQYQQPSQTPQYPPQYSQPQQQQPQQQGQVLYNVSQVMSCLSHVLTNSLLNVNTSKFLNQTELSKAITEQSDCILPRR